MKTFKPFKHSQVVDTETLLARRGQRVTHGDVIIVRAAESDVPSNFNALKDAPEGVLAEGEHSNHAHQLFYDMTPAFQATKSRANLTLVNGTKDTATGTFSLKAVSKTELWLKVENEPVLLKHQEHNPYRIYPGVYRIGFQQEQDHFKNLRKTITD